MADTATQDIQSKEAQVITDGEILSKTDISHAEVARLSGLTEEELVEEKKLVRRIDWLIMPLLLAVYLLNWIDRNNYAAARLQGLERDLNLSPQQYQTGLSILFVGYILGQVPSNLLLNYCGRPSWYLGFFTIAWGIVSALTFLCKSFGEIMACRFILGIVEAPFFPGVLFYLSKWYTKKEMNLRMSIFYSGAIIAGAFGNLIAAGILSGLAGKNGMSAWQWLYIIEGALTIFFGIIVILVLPDFPQTWRALTPEMKHVANRRLALEAAEVDVDEAGGMSQIRGLKLAVTDIKVWLFALFNVCITAGIGMQNFFPTMTATLGYGRTMSLLLVAPPYIFMTFWSYFHGHMSDRFGKRFWFLFYPVPVSIIGLVIFMNTDAFGPRYFSFFPIVFILAQNGTMYSWVAGALPRPPAKRAAAYALVNSLGNSASIWTPFTYRDQDAPFYRPGVGIAVGLQTCAGILAILILYVLKKENKHLERLEHEDMPLSERDLAKLQKTAETEGIDLAAARRLQKGFRFML